MGVLRDGARVSVLRDNTMNDAPAERPDASR